MALASGTRLGPYEILSVIGAGGMGEVYKAKDSRLDRIVAIKILPSHLSHNSQLKQRFEREARAISSISHSNICSLYDIGHSNGTDYIVMEYLEGDSLARRLSKGPLPPEQVLRYGVQIAEALDKAHRQGIVHRDLKPANVVLTKSGAKLLDFGLAKLSEIKPEAEDQSQAQTNLNTLTEEGVVLGTVQYMAPEQLEGKIADERTDIFGLGEVLYEMATGKKTFDADSRAGLMSAILTVQPPPISSHSPLSPPALDHVVQKCLAKDPEERWQSAHDVASELRWISEQTSQSRMTSPAATAPRKFRISLSNILSAFFLLTTLVLGFWFYRFYRTHTGNPVSPEIQRLSFQLPENTTIGSPGSMGISPDGLKVAFAVTDKQGRTSLWLRYFDSATSHELPNTDDAAYPFWSPDSRYIGFFAQGRMKKIDINGGPAQVICEAPQGRGGSWNKDGQILFTPSVNSGLFLISTNDAKTSVVTVLNKSLVENSHRWPIFLPDGKHFFYTNRSSNQQSRGVYLGTLGSKETKRILPDSTKVEFVLPGYLLFIRDTNLMVVGFDPSTLQLSGEPQVLVQDLDVDFPLSAASFSTSINQKLIYMVSGSLQNQMVWYDRSGKELSKFGKPGIYYMANLSPDGKTISLGIPEVLTGGYDVWTVDLARGTFSRLTSNPATDTGSIWSPDGKSLIFDSNRAGVFDLFEISAFGSGEEKLILHTEDYKQVNDWSSDGRHLIYETIRPKTNSDLFVLPMTGDAKPYPYLASEFNEAHSQFSPDGKWVAYASDETGRSEVYVQSFPIAVGTKRQVSTAGGDQPTWRKDQKELFYLGADGKLMAVPLANTSGIEPGVPVPLFQAHFGYNPIASSERAQYTVSSDGQRFLLENLAKLSSETPINVILNWTNLLKK